MTDDVKPTLRAWEHTHRIPSMASRRGDRGTAMGEPRRAWLSTVEAVPEKAKTKRRVPFDAESVTAGGVDQ